MADDGGVPCGPGDAAAETAANRRPRGASLAAELISIGFRWARWQHRLVRLAAAFDDSGAWVADGAPTAAHWIADQLDVEVSTAREWIRVGRALEVVSLVDSEFAEGGLSYSKVRNLIRIPMLVDHERELCELAKRVPASQLAAALAGWLAGREDPDERDRRHRRERNFRCRTDVDGMIVGSFRLPPLEGGGVMAAVDSELMKGRTKPTSTTEGGQDAAAAASESTESDEEAVIGPSPRETMAQQRADAFVRLFNQGGRSIVTELVLHVRADGCTLDDGTPISGSIVERIAPDSFLRLLIHDAERRPINASGRHRHPTDRQKRVVKERDRHCVDCGSKLLLQYDHEPPFEDSLRTLVDELELRCAPCHTRRHDGDDRPKRRRT